MNRKNKKQEKHFSEPTGFKAKSRINGLTTAYERQSGSFSRDKLSINGLAKARGSSSKAESSIVGLRGSF